MNESSTLSLREEFEQRRERFRVYEVGEEVIMEDLGVERFGSELQSLFAQDSNADYCISMPNVRHLSSAAIGKLMDFSDNHKRVRDRYAALAELQPEVYSPFRITCLDLTSFRMFETIDDYKANPLREPQKLEYAKV